MSDQPIGPVHEPGGDDPLSRATRALRDDAGAPGMDVSSASGPWQVMDGWARVARDLRRASRRRRALVLGGLQLLVALAGVGAWAAVSGRLPPLFSAATPVAPPPAPVPRSHRRASPRAVAASPQPDPPAPMRPAPPPPLPLRRQPVSIPAPTQRPPEAPIPDELYQEAHRAHFARRDYAAALAAWDRYLALGPATFTPEARYNRAIALIRLGRRQEAAAALESFLQESTGGYRVEQARALLRMLKPPP